MIGNGWISGQDQYLSYVPFMYEQGILQKGSTAANNADEQQRRCEAQLAAGDAKKVDTSTCEAIMQGLSRDLRSEDGQCYNVYDVRLKDSYPSCGMNWPPDLAQVTPYLRREDVRRALNLNPDQKAGWTECNNQVNFAFDASHSEPSKALLPRLLEHMPIVLFSGDKDLICNHIGTENLISNMSWNGGFGMEVNGQTAPIREWSMDGEPAGQYQEARNLTYLKFYNSSHMVPFDYPKRARDMLDRVIGGDIKTINGQPKNSVIEGENEKEVFPPNQGQDQDNGSKEPPPNSGDSGKESDKDSDWTLYYRSGEAALLVVVLAVAGWGFFVWRSRRRRALGYKSVLGDDPYDGNNGPTRGSRLGLATAEERFRNRERDLEAAAEEMDELDAKGEKLERERFSLGDDDEEDEGGGGSATRANGHV
jgi:carboxypeptidase D